MPTELHRAMNTLRDWNLTHGEEPDAVYAAVS